MTLRTRVLMVWFAFGLIGCATGSSEMDYLSVPPLGAGWKLAREREQGGVQRFREFVREGETVDKWSELITWHSARKRDPAPLPLDTMVASGIEFIQEICPGLVWSVIRRQEGSVLYEWRVSNCEPTEGAHQKLAKGQGGFRADPTIALESLIADQHAIALYMEGKWTVWRIEYTMKGKELPSEKREEWIRKFSEVRVETRVR